MLKHLLTFILFLSFFIAAKAQSHADSVANHSPVDSTAKHHLNDSAKKHSSAKGVVKRPSNDPDIKHSPVKTLSDERYNAYLKGDDLDNMALAGELNHFPLPDKVLKFKKELDLSPIQIGKLNQIATTLHRKKLEMGVFIIRNERMLDSLFRIKRQDEGSVIFYANRSGLYYGELRGAILMACYNTEKLLTDGQIKKLETLEKVN